MGPRSHGTSRGTGEMAKEKFARTKPHCNIGTIGHVDHGKTSLTAAITKILAESGGGTYTAYDQIYKGPGEGGAGRRIRLTTRLTRLRRSGRVGSRFRRRMSSIRRRSVITRMSTALVMRIM